MTQPYTRTPEILERQAEAQRGKKKPLSVRKAMSKGLKAAWERRRKAAGGMLGVCYNCREYVAFKTMTLARNEKGRTIKLCRRCSEVSRPPMKGQK